MNNYNILKTQRKLQLLLIGIVAGACLLFVVFAWWWKYESQALLYNGMREELSGNDEQALLYYHSAGALSFVSENSLQARFHEAALYYHRGQYLNAIPLLKDVTGRTSDPVPLLYLSKALAQEGRDDAALHYFYQLFEIDAYRVYAAEEIGLLYVRKGDEDRAAQWLHTAASQDINLVRSRYYLSLLLLHDRRDDAMRYLAGLATMEEESEYRDRARILQSRLEILSSEVLSEHFEYLAIAQVLNEIQEPRFAKEFLKKALEQYPSYRDAYILRAESHRLLGENTQYEGDLQRAQELDPEWSDGIQGLFVDID